MKKLLFGKIQEEKVRDKIIYHANFIEGKIKESFDNSNDLLDFLKMHAEGILKTGETNFLNFKYLNSKGLVHYLIVSKSVEGVIFIYEQTLFEFRKAYRSFFKQDINRRTINQRSYSFTDITRASSNFKIITEIFRLILISIMMGAILFSLITSLDFLVRKPAPLDFKIYQILALSNFFSMFLILVINIATIYAYNIVPKKQMADPNIMFDWRKNIKSKQKIRFLNITFLMVNIIIMAFYIGWLNHDHYFSIQEKVSDAAIANLSALILTFVIQLFVYIGIKISVRKNFKFYFPNISFKEYKKWYKDKTNSVKEKTRQMKEIFLFDSESSEQLNALEMEFSKNIFNKFTKEEKEEYIKKIKLNLKRAKNTYTQELEI